MVVEPFGQILNNWLFQGELWWTFVFEEVSWSEHCHPVFGQKIMGFHYNHLSPPLAVLMERNHSRYSRYSASLIGAYTCKGKPSKLILSFIISGRNTALLRFTQINRFHAWPRSSEISYSRRRPPSSLVAGWRGTCNRRQVDKMASSVYWCCRLFLSYPCLVIGSVLQTLSRSTSDVKILAYWIAEIRFMYFFCIMLMISRNDDIM